MKVFDACLELPSDSKKRSQKFAKANTGDIAVDIL